MDLFGRKQARFRRHAAAGFGRRRNPLAVRERRPRRRLRVFLSIAAVCGALLFAGFLLLSPAFSILEIRVDGASPDNAAVIRDLALRYLDERVAFVAPRRNTFVAGPEILRRRILDSVLLEDVTVTREGPHVLRINAREKQPRVVVLSAGGAFLADERGVIISKIPPDSADAVSRVVVSGWLTATSTPSSSTGTVFSAPRLPPSSATGTLRHPALLIADGRTLAPRDQAAPPEVFKAVLDSQMRLSAFGIDVLQASIATDHSLECAIGTNEGWDLLVLAGANLENQLTNLETVLKSTLRERAGLRYVDLRYGNRVFYK